MVPVNKKTFNPFPGLRPFAPEESDLFFGRKVESEEVLDKLINNKFVTVMGASGTGKSSLIFCGVLPRIRNLKDEKSGGWKIITFRPGNDPFGNLAKALSEETDKVPGTDSSIYGGITGMIKDYAGPVNEKILLVIDQFEELFRYSSPGDTDNSSTEKFVDSLVGAISEPSVNIFTIITMRSDYIGECAHYQGLTQLINNSNYLVPHMGKENYREAIEGPVKYAGARIDSALVETLLDDIGERTDQLPVLQHAMMRTWTYWKELDEPERSISKSDYESVGRMSNAMSVHANEAYEELSLRGKEICERMFKTITEKGSDNKGLRHPSGVKTIKSIAGCSTEELFEVVEKFRKPSRSFITPRQNVSLTEDSVIDLSHESLMRLWDRLREWVNDEASSVQMYRRLSEASAMYQQGMTSLWRPPDLQLAVNWRDQHKPTLAWAQQYDPAFERAMVYLRTSEKEYLGEEENKIRLQKRQMKRAKTVAMILGTAAIISVGFMLFAFVQKIAADRQTMIAVESRRQEAKQRQIADSAAIEAQFQKKQADSSANVATINADEAYKQRQIALVEQNRAQINAEKAREQERIALIQSDSAKRASLRADTNAALATKQKNNALRLRMLSIGKAMSIKSLQAQGQKDLQALLAFQAYLFNKNNNGIVNDADIYAGLYNVANQSGSSKIRSFKGHNGAISSIAYVPGKNDFFSSGSDGKILKWSPDSPDKGLQIIYSGNEITDVLAVSPNAEWLACGSNNNTIRLIPLKQSAGGYVLSGHTGKIKSLVFTFEGKYLYSAALDGKVLRWDLTARTSLNVSDGSVQITSIDISSNGKYIAGISTDGSVLVWDPGQASDNFRIQTKGKNIKAVRFNPENNLLAVGDITGNVELWDTNLKRKISEVKAHDAQINDIRFNPVLKQMATAGNDKKLKIFNLKDPYDLTEPPISFSDNEGFVLVMQFSPDGQIILSGTYEGTTNLISRPSHVDYFVSDICNFMSRNMTQDEWNTYVGRDIPLEQTCSDKPYNVKLSAKN